MRRLWFAVIALLVMCGSSKADDAERIARLIDRRISERWQAQKVEAAPEATDAEFLRRVWLDLAGRIPTAGQAREFLEDRRADKRVRLVDSLLESGAAVGHFTRTWREAWLPKQDSDRFPTYAARFDDFLRERLRRNVPYDRLVRDLLTSPSESTGAASPAELDQELRAPIGFFEANERKPEIIVASAAKNFLGVRIDCAQCHDHPFGAWKREQFWEMAAFFSSGRSEVEPSINIPEVNKVVPARFLNGQKPEWDKQAPNESQARSVLAHWVTAPSNPFFAKAAVNRVWGHCFGVGFVNPVDDMNATNPSSHPELLDELAAEFVATGFDLRLLLRGILRSKAYALTSRRTHHTQDDASDFARMPVKTLAADVLFYSVIRATGHAPNGPFGSSKSPKELRQEFVARFASTERAVDATTSIPQALTRMNGALTLIATDPAATPTLVALLEAPFLNDQQRVDELFLATYSRLPTESESRQMTAYLSARGNKNDRAAALADIFWALLNSHQFAVNH